MQHTESYFSEPCSERVVSYPLDFQGSPRHILLLSPFFDEKTTEKFSNLPRVTQLVSWQQQRPPRQSDSEPASVLLFVLLKVVFGRTCEDMSSDPTPRGSLIFRHNFHRYFSTSFSKPFSHFNLWLIKQFPRYNSLWSLKGFHVWTNFFWRLSKIRNKFWLIQWKSK